VYRFLNWIQQMDEAVLRWITENLRTPMLNKIIVFYTKLGNAGWLFILIALILLWKKATRRAGASALTSMTLGLVATNLILKPLVARPRPWVVMENFSSLVDSADVHSFPSGHTCAAFAFAVSICAVLPGKIITATALIAAAVMGFSRLYVGAHFLSDVLVGAAVGAVCGFAGARIISAVKNRISRE